jgi:Zn-dependent membrane protease YugP
VVRLSDPVATQPTVAAMAVCAHELGHVQQYQTGSALIGMRNFLLPALQFSPTISYIAIFLGLWFNMVNLMWIGIFFFALMVLFSFLTPRRRALNLLGKPDFQSRRRRARAVLGATLTYLAAAITSVLQVVLQVCPA